MANIAATAAALESYCGFSAARTRTVIRRLLDEKLLTPGAPGVAVEITEADLALLILAVASGAKTPDLAMATVALAECIPDGIDIDVMPATIRPAKRTAFDYLHHMVWNAAHGETPMKIDLEIVETWPEVCFHRDGAAARFQPSGSLAGHWQDSKQRRSTRIPASALALAASTLFKD